MFPRGPAIAGLVALIISASGSAAEKNESVLAKWGSLRYAATLHSIGLEWDIEGDTNHNATCAVRLRRKGEKEWRVALPLLRIDYRGWYDEKRMQAFRHFNMMAGSLMFLEPGGEYEIELTPMDPDEATKHPPTLLEIRTRPIPRLAEAIRTFHVIPGQGGGDGRKENPFRGIEAAEAVAEPGDLFLLHAGEYAGCTLTKSGSPGKYIAWKSAGDGPAILKSALGVKGSHIWIEGFVFEPADPRDFGGVRGKEHGHEEIVIIRNTFKNCRYAVSNTDRVWDGNPKELNRRWYIADNIMTGGPDAEYGLRMYMLADSDVCYNRVTTTHNGKGGDGIALRFSTNVDVHHNDLRDLDDDGFEPDYAYANMRFWCNRCVNPTYQGISFQPMLCSPWYIVRNEFVLLDPRRVASPFKTNVFDRFVLVNNTFVVRGRYAQASADVILRTFSRNNLWVFIYDNPSERTNPGGALWYGRGNSPEQRYQIHGQALPDWKTDVDYDGFAWEGLPIPHPGNAFWWYSPEGRMLRFNDLPSFSKAIGIEEHARHLEREKLFEHPDLLAYAQDPFSSKRLTLKENSAAIDAGQAVPNLCEEFTGVAPDLGAHEYGKPLPHYGPR